MHKLEVLLCRPDIVFTVVPVVDLQAAPRVPVVVLDIGVAVPGGNQSALALLHLADVELVGQLIAQHGSREAAGHRLQLVDVNQVVFSWSRPGEVVAAAQGKERPCSWKSE